MSIIFFFNDTATTEIYTLSLHDALPIYRRRAFVARDKMSSGRGHQLPLLVNTKEHAPGDHRRIKEVRRFARLLAIGIERSEEHTSELQSQSNLVCRLLLEKKKTKT